VSGLEIGGRVFARGKDGYEDARRAAVWHGRVPERYPDLIVQAADESDVIAAVLHAGAESMKVAVRSRGHSWSGNCLREGGMLIDVSRLDSVAIDKASMTATAGPGRAGDQLNEMLEAEGCFFPTGHCRGVGLGGYLLQGGYGWNGRFLGLACESVLGVDVVTADGVLRRASAEQDSELYWSARGSGAGFFGVVTNFHLRIYEMPAVCAAAFNIYPTSVLEEFFTWAHSVGHELDRRVEMQVTISRSVPHLGIEEPAITLGATVFVDSEEEARAAVAVFETCPVREQALLSVPYMELPLSSWYDGVMTGFPSPANRFAVDNMWITAPIAEFLPGLRAIVDTLPPHPAQVFWFAWGRRAERPDIASALEDDYYVALYGQWEQESDDDLYAQWAVGHMRSLEHLSSGIQLADENLGERWTSFTTPEALQRLDRARAAYDPAGRFHQWPGRA
jgi:FAD/FMN-containing dehydrogenase